MSLPKRRENSLDYSTSESNDPSTTSFLSDYLIESSDESCPDSIYEEYLSARNYWNRRKNALAQKEILERAYKFIYDEPFSNESTNESDSQFEFWSKNSNRRKSAMPAGDGNDLIEFRKPDARYRSDLGPRISAENLEEFDSDSLFGSSAENFEAESKRKIPSKKWLKNNVDSLMRRKRKLLKIGRTEDSRWQKPADILIEGNKYLESSSSDESFVIDVESVLQENFRGRLTVETVLLENTKNEAKLLGEIKKRIDQDFEGIESGESIFYTESLEYFNCDKAIVESTDSGVSTDFSRNESDPPKSFDYPEATGSSDIFDRIISVNYDADDGEILEARVDEAVKRFTEELIMCERRAEERGLTGMSPERKKRKRKSLRKVRKSSSSSQRSDRTSSSPRFFPTSQSSGGSEEEYIGNISTPPLCSISDSEMENL